jgi:hypothetical protein
LAVRAWGLVAMRNPMHLIKRSSRPKTSTLLLLLLVILVDVVLYFHFMNHTSAAPPSKPQPWLQNRKPSNRGRAVHRCVVVASPVTYTVLTAATEWLDPTTHCYSNRAYMWRRDPTPPPEGEAQQVQHAVGRLATASNAEFAQQAMSKMLHGWAKPLGRASKPQVGTLERVGSGGTLRYMLELPSLHFPPDTFPRGGRRREYRGTGAAPGQPPGIISSLSSNLNPRRRRERRTKALLERKTTRNSLTTGGESTGRSRVGEWSPSGAPSRVCHPCRGPWRTAISRWTAAPRCPSPHGSRCVRKPYLVDSVPSSASEEKQGVATAQRSPTLQTLQEPVLRLS